MMKFKSVLSLIVIAIAAILLFSSCEEERPTRLSQQQQTIKDSVLTVKLREASHQTDSVCEVRTGGLVQHYYDSILDVRLEEIRKLRQRR